MVERYDGEQLPPAHPVMDGRPPLPDGLGVPQPTPLPPRELRRYRLVAVVAAIVVLAAIVLGALR
ncbi:hypothetical protein DER29_4367 [Micromonospora sp. M71_S20]|uniref:hypothetical protein n=1 Tax=Micromonospora sp. M71_S20 TaxID=592872 RepID=UPI000EB3F3D0|nr:hypothetical protein [Micromonospora sp. M71_S20]RLK13348.1 hypothetical protein DER29_4367 [Micromonospora sp. M71_S20]